MNNHSSVQNQKMAIPPKIVKVKWEGPVQNEPSWVKVDSPSGWNWTVKKQKKTRVKHYWTVHGDPGGLDLDRQVELKRPCSLAQDCPL